MANIKTVKYQTLIGLAIQQYGTVDALPEMIALNDLTGKMNQPDKYAGEVDLGYSLKEGENVVYDENSPLRNAKVISIISGVKITDGFERSGVYSQQYSKKYD